MYDAKIQNKDKNALKYSCIADSSYFPDLKSENIINIKTSYVPIDISNSTSKYLKTNR